MGTMNLTEPQAGSDLSMVRTRAEPLPDGSYKIFGTKIFITWGEHDMAENIVHLVLARVAGAPEGVKGISLFIVPKFMLNADGSRPVVAEVSGGATVPGLSWVYTGLFAGAGVALLVGAVVVGLAVPRRPTG